MPTPEATEKWTARSLTIARNGKWAAERAWDVIQAETEEAAIAAVVALGPLVGAAIGASHRANALLICNRLHCDPGLVRKRVVRASYAMNDDVGEGGVIDHRPRIIPSFGTYSEPLMRTVDDASPYANKPILNSTNQLFDPRPEVSKS